MIEYSFECSILKRIVLKKYLLVAAVSDTDLQETIFNEVRMSIWRFWWRIEVYEKKLLLCDQSLAE